MKYYMIYEGTGQMSSILLDEGTALHCIRYHQQRLARVCFEHRIREIRRN